MKPNFLVAILTYAGLALIAGWCLDGKIRGAIWIFLGGLAVRTWIARAARW